MSCCEPPPLPFIRMLTLNHVSLLVSRTTTSSSAPYPDDANNNVSNALALKMISRASRLAGHTGGSKRCLFGSPSAADTQRLLREDQDAAKARMARRWGWDLTADRPSTATSTWQWEPVRPARPAPRPVRPHPYGLYTERRTSPMTSPKTPAATLDTSTTSSSSGTSTLPESPSSPEPFPLALPSSSPSSESGDSESEDSCCGDSGSDSDSSTTCGTSPRPLRPHLKPVQTRLTDFWRTRRCSASENVIVVKPNPLLAGSPKTRTTSTTATATSTPRTCSV